MATKAAKKAARALCQQYDGLTSDDQRREFWRKNEAALSARAADVSCLAIICMTAAKPLSRRARANLNFQVRNEPQHRQAK
ncbi:MAG TPA: hypothetical protein VH170_05855 [Chthoniobacterales bacterium]|nr:hypothetical protein [Chthoniobacterales bacterium]